MSMHGENDHQGTKAKALRYSWADPENSDKGGRKLSARSQPYCTHTTPNARKLVAISFSKHFQGKRGSAPSPPSQQKNAY